jgi:hypothetical protein
MRARRLDRDLPPARPRDDFPAFDGLDEPVQGAIAGAANAAAVVARSEVRDPDDALVRTMLELTELAQRDPGAAVEAARQIMAEAHARCP